MHLYLYIILETKIKEVCIWRKNINDLIRIFILSGTKKGTHRLFPKGTNSFL